MSGESLNGGPKKLLCEAVKVKSLDRVRNSQDVRGTTTMGYLPGKDTHSEWNQPKENACYKQQSQKGRDI